MQDTWVWSLGQENPQEKGMSTHSSILAWKIPQTKELGGLQSVELQRVKHNWMTEHTIILYVDNLIQGIGYMGI